MVPQTVLVRGLCRSKPVLRGPALGTVLSLALRPLPDARQQYAAGGGARGGAADGAGGSAAGGGCKAGTIAGGADTPLISEFILHFLTVPAVVHYLTTALPEVGVGV